MTRQHFNSFILELRPFHFADLHIIIIIDYLVQVTCLLVLERFVVFVCLNSATELCKRLASKRRRGNTP